MRVLGGFRIVPSRVNDYRTSRSRFSTPARNVSSIVPLLCRDNCVAVGKCSPRARLCALSVPGGRVQIKLCHDLLPGCVNVGAIGKAAAVTGVSTLVHHGSVSKTVRVLRTCLTAIPCYGGISSRKRCRRVVCIVFSVLSGCMSMRIHAPSKEMSVMLEATARLCLFRLGLGGSTSTTVGRVGLGRCPGHFTLDNLPVMGIKIGFSITARGVAS